MKQPSAASLADTRLVFLDLQTTGASPQHGHVLEMAWCLAAAAQERPLSCVSHLIKQPDGEPVPSRITALTGITEQAMSEAVDVATARAQLLKTLATSDAPSKVLIHFAKFERSFLAQDVLPQEIDQIQLLCTHQVAARLFPNLPSRGIRGLAGYFGLSMDECKRASSHVQATFIIWRNLCAKLMELGVDSVEELEHWLSETTAAKRTKYEYPLDKKVRLSMPDNPGVYRMLSSSGQILYVGKATSLKSRVNSYFRGQRGRDSRKLEMLTQTWDIAYSVCDSVVEACVREVEEIKTLSPPYNVALKTPDRPLVFYSCQFDSLSVAQDEHHVVGPFRSELVMDAFVRLCWSLTSNEFDPLMFYEELPPSLLADGFEVFLSRRQLDRARLCSGARTLLAIGFWLRRRYAGEADEEVVADQEDDSETGIDPLPAETPAPLVVDLTPDQVADKYERLLMRAAGAYRLAKILTRLLHAHVTFEENGKLHELRTNGAALVWGSVAEPALGALGIPAPGSEQPPWLGLTIAVFDRLRVLHTELCRIKEAGSLVRVEPYAPKAASYTFGSACRGDAMHRPHHEECSQGRT